MRLLQPKQSQHMHAGAQRLARIRNLRAHKCTAHSIFLFLYCHCGEDCSFRGVLNAPSMLTYPMCGVHTLQQLHWAHSWHQGRVSSYCGSSARPSLVLALMDLLHLSVMFL